jgi:isopropylmalate/homocitrate/citramalate synthase
MLRKDERRYLLEENDYQYSLQDIPEPQLYRDMFSYDTVPKISFNHRSVPMYMPDKIWITDTTFRDGQQSRSPFTVKQVVDLFKLEHRLGGPNGLVRQSEFFVYTAKDREALEACLSLGYEFPEVTTWIRANEKDFELVKEIGVKETGILVSCSDYHIFKKMNLSRKQAMDKYLGIVRKSIEKGINPRCHFEDITRADFYGFVVPFATELHRLMDDAKMPIKIRMCDTLGYGVSFPGAAMPRSVPGLVYGLRFYAGFPSELLEWHGHNDFYKVVTNSTTAWLYGCASVNASLLGIGERTGNCPLEAMTIEYASLMGDTDGMNLSVITEIAEYFENELNYEIHPRMPFVGRNFNATRAGIHADGLLKDEEIYNIFDTQKILNRPVVVAVDAHSGAAGITHWINQHFKLKDEHKADKRSNLVAKIKEEIDRDFEAGRTTAYGDDELETIIKSIDMELFVKLSHHLKLNGGKKED